MDTHVLISILLSAISLLGVIMLQVWAVVRCVRLTPHFQSPVLALGTAMGLLVLLHICEIIIFAQVFHLGCEVLDLGTINRTPASWDDYFYYSFATFTTVGYGDVVIRGPITLLSGVVALTGSMLMASSATITFLLLKEHVIDHAFDGREQPTGALSGSGHKSASETSSGTASEESHLEAQHEAAVPTSAETGKRD